MAKERTIRDLRHGGFFFLSSVGAGLLNYLFQVISSRHLSATQFSQFNGWFADLSLFFMVGGLIQYAGCFWPARKSQLRFVLTVANLLTLGAVLYWIRQPGVLTLDRAVLILLVSNFFGWLMGQAQIRTLFVAISVVNLVCSASKLATVWLPMGGPDQIDRYAFALFVNFLPGLWIVTLSLWNSAPYERTGPPPSWGAPLIMSVTNSLIPQFDLVLMNHTQDQARFSDFSHASLFYKGIYFLVFIAAQWLLPRQLKSLPGRRAGDGPSRGSSAVLNALPLLVLATFSMSVALALVSPWISHLILNWPDPPARPLVFLTCLHTSLLAMLFLWIQESCASHRVRYAAAITGLLIFEALLQWQVFRLEMTTYLFTAITLQSITLGALYWILRRRGVASVEAVDIQQLSRTG